MKRKLLAILIIGVLIISVACSNESADPDTGAEATSKENTEKDNDDKVGARSNPVDIGQSVEWDVKFYSDIEDWDALEGLAKVTLNKVYKDQEALDMLYFKEEALEDVEEGYTFAVADYTVELIEGNDDSPYTTSFDIGSVSEDGRKSPFDYQMLSDEYEDNEYTDLYPGGSVDIKMAFLVPVEGDYLIEIEENISGSKFFKSE